MGFFRPPPRQDTGAAPADAPARRHGLLRRLFRRLPWEIRLALLAPIYLGIPAFIGIACAFVYYTTAIPNPKTLRQKERPPIVRILARDGAVLSRARQRRSLCADRPIPRHLIDAWLRPRGPAFLQEHGGSIPGAGRAAFANLAGGGSLRAARTLPSSSQEPVPELGAPRGAASSRNWSSPVARCASASAHP